MAKLVSKTYGEALFELALEENKVDVFLEEILGVKKVLEDNQDFSKLLNHPKILKEEKIQVLENVFKGRISDELTGFLGLIITKDRYRDLDSILEFFLTQVKKHKGISVAYVTTAVELREERKKQIEQKLLETTGSRQMEMHYSIDKGLIAGAVIRIGDRVVDSSVKSKLGDLQRQLLKIQLT